MKNIFHAFIWVVCLTSSVEAQQRILSQINIRDSLLENRLRAIESEPAIISIHRYWQCDTPTGKIVTLDFHYKNEKNTKLQLSFKPNSSEQLFVIVSTSLKDKNNQYITFGTLKNNVTVPMGYYPDWYYTFSNPHVEGTFRLFDVSLPSSRDLYFWCDVSVGDNKR